jgi:hypothetical protein
MNIECDFGCGTLFRGVLAIQKHAGSNECHRHNVS